MKVTTAAVTVPTYISKVAVDIKRIIVRTFVCKNQSDMFVENRSKESLLNQSGNKIECTIDKYFFSLKCLTAHRNTMKAEGNEKGRITKHKCMKLLSMIYCQLNIVLVSPLWIRSSV